MAGCPENCPWCPYLSTEAVKDMLSGKRQDVQPIDAVFEEDGKICEVTSVVVTKTDRGDIECRVSGEKEGVGRLGIKTSYF
jgi:hypothetical protein